MPKFTQSEIQSANDVSIVDLFRKAGCDPIKKGRDYWAYNPFWNEGQRSVKLSVSKNKWKNYGDHEQSKYKDAIDFIVEHEKRSWSEAVSFLLSGDYEIKKIVEEKDDTPYFEIVEEEKITDRGLIWYIASKRKIDFRTARRYCKELHVKWPNSQNPDYVSKVVGFPNKSGGFEIRNKKIKITLIPNTYSIIEGNNDILLFEGFFNFLALLTILGKEEVDQTVIVLNGTGNYHYCLPRLKEADRVLNYMDNGNGGDKATATLLLNGVNLIERRNKYIGYSDINDYLCDGGRRTRFIRHAFF